MAPHKGRERLPDQAGSQERRKARAQTLSTDEACSPSPRGLLTVTLGPPRLQAPLPQGQQNSLGHLRSL